MFLDRPAKTHMAIALVLVIGSAFFSEDLFHNLAVIFITMVYGIVIVLGLSFANKIATKIIRLLGLS